jgi:hypothetical protein
VDAHPHAGVDFDVANPVRTPTLLGDDPELVPNGSVGDRDPSWLSGLPPVVSITA